jgi:hypothetical protein
MPLPPAATRKLFHERSIRCRGYFRDDGLWDIEARLVDTRSYTSDVGFRHEVPAGEAVHEMLLRLTIDSDLVIQEAIAITEIGPYPSCSSANSKIPELKGVRIAFGWRGEVDLRLGGRNGCAHIRELLGPIATAAIQTLAPRRGIDDRDRNGRPTRIDSCHAYASDGEVVRRYWPDHSN